MSEVQKQVVTVDGNEYEVELEAEEGGFIVSVPSLQGCLTQGENLEDALAMARDAIKCWLEASES